MADSGYILVPQSVQVAFDVFTPLNIVNTIHELSTVDDYTGLGKWVYDAAAKMSPERRRMNSVVFGGFKPLTYEIVPPKRSQQTFEDYLSQIRHLDPEVFRKSVFEFWINKATHVKNQHAESTDDVPSFDEVTSDPQAFLKLMDLSYGEDVCAEDYEIWEEAHDMLKDPQRTLDAIIEYFQYVWNDLDLKGEWRRNLPLLEESVAAYSKLNYENMSVIEALKAVTGRDLSEVWGEYLQDYDMVTFVPSPTIGPYVSFRGESERSVIMFFGVRMPREMEGDMPELSRPELLIRLNALADDNRLKILEMLTENDELFAQDIIEALGLSQSSVSRHLSQLSATGFVIERRKEVSKCYSLNTERVADTLKALGNFLSK